MKKILMLASEASHFRNFHIPYIKYLQHKGDKVFTASNGSFDMDGVSHFYMPFKKKLISFGNIKVIFKLAGLMRKGKFDIVYTNSTLAGFMGRMAVILSRQRYTKAYHICHGYLFNDDGGKKAKIYLFFEKLVRKRTDLLVVMNNDDLEIAKKYSLGKQISFVNGMGLNTEMFPPVADEKINDMRKSLDADENTLLFLCAAEFSPRKDQYTIIKALSLLKRSDCRVIFAGDGQLLEECRVLAKQLGVDNKTAFLGYFDNMNLLYRSCDCLISAGQFEGLPFNVMEALYCGENIILSDVKGNRDLSFSVESVSGTPGQSPADRLFPHGDFKALSELMEKAEKPLSRNCRLSDKYFLKKVLDENVKLFHMDD
ncbi:MAG: glycosyltransferase family 4 protein [Ruminococcaceae bacterium]|nr:glycosyltransferase family 4 protein [Oscillospiraceae bacterium]